MKGEVIHTGALTQVGCDDDGVSRRNGRALHWDVDTVCGLRSELIDSLGAEGARQILKRFGFANGYRDGRAAGELMRWDDDCVSTLFRSALRRGDSGIEPTVEHLVVDRETAQFEMRIAWLHSHEAEHHRRVRGHSDRPSCWTISGFCTGFASALMADDVLFVETECAAMGGQVCRVVGRMRADWGEEGSKHAADYWARPFRMVYDPGEADAQRRPGGVSRLEGALADGTGPRNGKINGIIWRSRAMQDVLDLARIAARQDDPVLITGERGVGKQCVARFIHDQSRRADRPFVVANCEAISSELLDGVLFGRVQVERAPAGAARSKKGLLEAAAGGTLFLDEIGAMSPATQLRLLQALQERELVPVGEARTHRINARIVAATNRDLEEMARGGGLREDLLTCLTKISMEVPPLRARVEDILPLAHDILVRLCKDRGVEAKTLSAEVAEALSEYPWLGNVRELQCAIERAVLLSDDRRKICLADLPPKVCGGSEAVLRRMVSGRVIPIAELERRYILDVLEHFEGNRTHTARALGIASNTLWRKLKGWGIPPGRAGE